MHRSTLAIATALLILATVMPTLASGQSGTTLAIDGNSELLAAQAENGWTGTGNPGDPILIDTVPAGTAVVSLQGTTLHVQVEGLQLGSGSRIVVGGAENVHVANNTLVDGSGLFVVESTGVELVSNQVLGSGWRALELRNPGTVHVRDNTIQASHAHGIRVLWPSCQGDCLTDVRIVGNTVSGYSGWGLRVMQPLNQPITLQVQGNTFLGTGGSSWGLNLGGVGEGTPAEVVVRSNRILGHHLGLGLDGTQGVLFTDNLLDNEINRLLEPAHRRANIWSIEPTAALGPNILAGPCQAGNAWSDHESIDANRDGIAENAYPEGTPPMPATVVQRGPLRDVVTDTSIAGLPGGPGYVDWAPLAPWDPSVPLADVDCDAAPTPSYAA